MAAETKRVWEIKPKLFYIFEPQSLSNVVLRNLGSFGNKSGPIFIDGDPLLQRKVQRGSSEGPSGRAETPRPNLAENFSVDCTASLVPDFEENFTNDSGKAV
jgi:hypothetical protein